MKLGFIPKKKIKRYLIVYLVLNVFLGVNYECISLNKDNINSTNSSLNKNEKNKTEIEKIVKQENISENNKIKVKEEYNFKKIEDSNIKIMELIKNLNKDSLKNQNTINDIYNKNSQIYNNYLENYNNEKENLNNKAFNTLKEPNEINNYFRFKSDSIRPEMESPVIIPRSVPSHTFSPGMPTTIIAKHNLPNKPPMPIPSPMEIVKQTIIPPRYNKYSSILNSPYMSAGRMRQSLTPSPWNIEGPLSQMNRMNNICPCAAFVKCPPCGIAQNSMPPISCPCAPKPVCKKCPPLSIVHEMASRKALQDQKLASELKNLSTSMTQMFKNISKFAGDVLKFELEAKEASLKMEESSLKAQFSRQQMVKTSEKARLIAKNTINGPCLVNCDEVPGSPGDILGMSPGSILGNYIDDSKIFPQEVESIGDFMKDTYSTNINGFNARENEYYNNNKLEAESEGSIRVESLGSSETTGTINTQSNQLNRNKLNTT